MKEVHVYDYTLKNSKTKLYGYRFETAKINGKRHWANVRGFTTKEAAKQAGKEALQRYEGCGTLITPSEMSFSDFLDMWFEQHDIKDTTRVHYEKEIRLHIKPALGSYMIKSIRAEQVQGLITKLYHDGYARKTLISIKGILNKVFEYAVDHHYIVSSPAEKVKIPKKVVPKTETRTHKREYVPKDVMNKVLDRFPEGTTQHLGLMLGYRCGLRLGEVYALTWDNIDFANKTLTVDKQVQWMKDPEKPIGADPELRGRQVKDCKSCWYLTEPKYNETRTIDIDNDLLELFRREKERQEYNKNKYGEYYHYYHEEGTQRKIVEGKGNKPLDLVHRQQSGWYINSRVIAYALRVVHYELGYKIFDFHSLRHTHATNIINAGADLKYVQKRLGHKNIETTLNIYYELNPDKAAESKELLNKMF